VLALARPGITLAALVFMWGAYAIADGVLAMVAGWQIRDHGRPLWSLFVVGALGIAAGVVTYRWPVVTAQVLLMVVASWAIVVSNNPLPALDRDGLRHPSALGPGAPRGGGAGASGKRSAGVVDASLEIKARSPVPVGVDGEALVIDPPLRFSSRPAALRCRVARHHPGASPAALAPERAWTAVRALAGIAAGRDPRPLLERVEPVASG